LISFDFIPVLKNHWSSNKLASEQGRKSSICTYHYGLIVHFDISCYYINLFTRFDFQSRTIICAVLNIRYATRWLHPLHITTAAGERTRTSGTYIYTVWANGGHLEEEYYISLATSGSVDKPCLITNVQLFQSLVLSNMRYTRI